jgi:plastocyanin
VAERRLFLGALLAAGTAGAATRFAAPGAPGASASAAAASSPTAPAAHTVVIEGMVFAPATLVVRRGERITWVNRDLVAHTVTARDGSFDSGSIAAGASWSTVATRVGRRAYTCSLHPTMTAILDIR